ncbi:polysaccharide pyruvyl transferase family protein [Flagellimonas aequoris]|uniref:Polysaccharide biosynthesis protein n=1 Tax=Flagellimonas aequoris TaxID=2306997 RepID=A0A418NCQ3_9FLAO|nr:polysaccharide pyruvyl transferase family protein [Allomuricauda aequoris]RIV74385.1 polysaccharide biosynthesis protein [Allomuricauda aequoris]TXK08507.1 polysaccharide biosynthesis protein [Allomuricauda aequoris]
MIKRLIPFSWKAQAQLFLNRNKTLADLGISVSGIHDRHIFIFLAADYGNLGDVAITYAQHKFLQENFKEYQVIEIPISCTLEGVAAVKNCIQPGDIITTVGGGNMGDLYPMIEYFRQLVIKSFKKNPIICFPQTVDFSVNPKGKRALEKAKKVYSAHPNLTLLAREEKSYSFFREHFSKNKSFEVPDIVMTLFQQKKNSPRKGGLICLRDDREKKLNREQEQKLADLFNNAFNTTEFRDTHIGGDRFSLRQRTSELFKIWKHFSSVECVVTDRLHGMIFCYITGTPALVFLNNNHKIKSSYKWIVDTGNIYLIEDFDEMAIKDLLDKIKKNVKSPAPYLDLKNKYQDFLEEAKPNL